MKEYLNESTLFMTVMMYIQESSQLVLVVEGDDDHLVLKNHCTADLRLIAGVGGREQVLRSAALVSSQKIERARFLVDRDYEDYKISPNTFGESVHVSSGHDVFMDFHANNPDVLRRVIEVHVARAERRPKRGKISHMPAPDPKTIEADSLALASHLAAVRIVDARRNLNLDFRRFSFGGLNVSDFNIRAVASEMIMRRGYRFDESQDIIGECVETRKEIEGRQELVVGDHDFFSALARVLKQFEIFVSDKTLQNSFIMGISCSSVRADGWFMEIQSWCARNSHTGFDCGSDFDIAA